MKICGHRQNIGVGVDQGRSGMAPFQNKVLALMFLSRNTRAVMFLRPCTLGLSLRLLTVRAVLLSMKDTNLRGWT